MALIDFRRSFETVNGSFVGVEITANNIIQIDAPGTVLTWDEALILAGFLNDASDALRAAIYSPPRNGDGSLRRTE